jgi:hypothetical protein
MTLQTIIAKTTRYFVRAFKNSNTKLKTDFVRTSIFKYTRNILLIILIIIINATIIITQPSFFVYYHIFLNFIFPQKILAFSDVEIKEIKPVVISDSKILTNLDGLYECVLYLSLRYESECIGSKKLIIYSILLLIREKFQETIGISDEISRKIISGELGNLVSEEEIKRASVLLKYGISSSKILDELRKIKLLNEKLKRNFFTDLATLREIVKNVYVEPIFGNDKTKQKNQEIKIQEIKETASYELIKTLIPENTKIISDR